MIPAQHRGRSLPDLRRAAVRGVAFAAASVMNKQ